MNQTDEDQGRIESSLQGPAGLLHPNPVPRGEGKSEGDQPVVRALEDYLAALEEERAPECQEFLARYPDIAAELADCLQGLEFIRSAFSKVRQPLGRGLGAASPTTDIQPEGPLGDYRLVREIGRGGMGVVYEAVQISLGRRVALKVLPFAAALDSKQLQRFKNEAQAAAQLHHTNIVPVHGVGCERGVHYYAMQFIEGQTLAQVIRELRQTSGLEKDVSRPDAENEEKQTVDYPLHSPRLCGQVSPSAVPGVSVPQSPLTATPPAAALSTEGSNKTPGFFHTVANLGVQAAEALEHAHQLGIVHRDIKPANLLVDERGNLWITDFGLAQIQGDTKLTMTGDLLGTLRYMSPEQALAQRVIVDHRTDIYSLGATLYELLTLEPAFNGRDRQEVLRQIAFEEPKLPARINRALPAELETIVLKAIAKNPEERYTTAKELANDLERFLEDKPIRAKRPTLVQRAKKWARRHVGVVVTAGTALVVFLVLVAIGATIALLRERNLTNDALEKAAAEKQAREERDVALYFQRIALAERELATNQGARAEALLDLCRPDERGWEWHFLKRRIHEEPLVLTGHTSGLGAVAFSPNGQVLASASYDATVRLWDPVTGKLLRSLSGKPPGFVSVAFSPNGQLIAAANWDASVTVWDLAANQERVLKGHADRACGVAFSPDSRHLASCSDDQTVNVWDLRTGKKMVLSGHAGEVAGVAFSPDGTRLASASEDQTVKIWDAQTGQPILGLTGHRGGVWAVAFSPDGNYLASAGGDRTVRIWDAITGREVRVLSGHTSDVNAVAFSPDGRRLASAGEDTTVRFWDPATGQEALTLRDHTAPIYGVAFSPDGYRLASAGHLAPDNRVRVWHATPANDESPHPLHAFAGHTQDVTCLAFNPDGSLLASGSLDRTVWVQDAATGDVIQVLQDPQVRAISGVTFSPDGSRVAADDGNGIVGVWQTRTGQKVWGHALKASHNSLAGVAYSPDGRRLALADAGRFVRILDAATGEEHALLTLPMEIGGVKAVAYRPDGQRLAAACTNRTVCVWDMSSSLTVPPGEEGAGTGRGLQTLRGHQSQVTSVAYRGDGRYLASAGVDGWLILWDATAGEAVREAWRVRAHRDAVNAVAFSPNGRRLATASRDGTVKLWDANSDRLLRIYHARQGEVYAVAFNPDGKTLASGGTDGTVKIWEVPPGEVDSRQ